MGISFITKVSGECQRGEPLDGIWGHASPERSEILIPKSIVIFIIISYISMASLTSHVTGFYIYFL